VALIGDAAHAMLLRVSRISLSLLSFYFFSVLLSHYSLERILADDIGREQINSTAAAKQSKIAPMSGPSSSSARREDIIEGVRAVAVGEEA
jgi:hypothetical protein